VEAHASPAPDAAARPALDPELRARLLRRLEAATTSPSASAMAALRSAATDLVDHLKADGLPAERVLAIVDTLLRQHGVVPRPPTLHVAESPRPDGVVLHRRLLDWCARAYQCDDWW
jgi:hypothetical protein